ncbi:MAG: helix-turn-helix domain-containing protein [Lachnospiraceae bacterium]|nr:helix-turn-helix domain-containing protein [Lachnospiraceae bacterium]
MRECEGTGQEYYTVSEAVQRCGVPSHVLRYWEDELRLPIRRTAQGHRVYSEKDLAVFAKVKELKEKGIQLKAIRLLLEDSDEGHSLEKLLGEKIEAAGARPAEPGAESDESDVTFVSVPNISAFASETEIGEKNTWTDRREDENTGAGGCEDESCQSAEEYGNYEIIPTAEADNYRRFEEMLRSLIGEVVAEQNERLERTLSERIHEEMEDLYIQLQQEEARREAAAAENRTFCTAQKEGILRRIQRILSR